MRAILAAIATGALRAEAVLAVSNKESAGALAAAREYQIATRVIPTLPDPEAADRSLRDARMDARADLVVLSGYLRKLGPCTLRAFERRILNTHPALLPKFGGKGMYGGRVHEAVLAAGAHETGATIHLVDGEYDHGPILARRTVAIAEGADVESVERSVIAAEQLLFVETLAKIEAGDIHL